MSENASIGTSGLTLLVMRHSKAEPTAETDHVRRLTDRGHDDASAAGVWVASSGHVPELILASSAARAEETAQLVASLCNVRRVELVDDLYAADGYEVLDIVAAHTPDDVATAMVVGHNPTMAQVGSLLLGEGADEIRFPTSGIGVFGLDVETWADLDESHGRLLASYTRD
jgi:phosphohistidine phosphatase